MKTIQCDLCKKILGKEVNIGMYSIETAQFSPNNFWKEDSFGQENRSVDICSECSNKICVAQNIAVKEIQESKITS